MVQRKGALGSGQALEDFAWAKSDEPHAARRKAMLTKSPEITSLYGPDPMNKWRALATLALQLTSAWLFTRYLSLTWPTFLLVAWLWGGTWNHSMMLAIHELSHDLFFPAKWMNEWFGIVCNACLGIPMAASFRKYHMIHHRYQGLDGIDPDLPSSFEGQIFRSVPGKLLFLLLQPVFYVFRPLLFYPTAVDRMEVVQYVGVAVTDLLVLLLLGPHALLYLLLSSVLGSGLHPLAAHFVAEHYTWEAGFETYSYYGPLNRLVYNVGWHNEHHDFPRVPGSRLPELHRIAPEFYAPGTIGVLPSWPGIMWRFITDAAITPFSRVKRHQVQYAPEL